MKRCPECRRDYNDDSLSFCLDDGAELLFGPARRSEPGAAATGFPSDEPPTAILSEPGAVATGFRADEAPTRAQIHTTAAEPQSHVGEVSEKQSFSANRAAEPQNRVGEPSEKQSFSANRAAKPQGGFDKRLLLVPVALVSIALGGFFGYRYLSPGSSKQISSIAVMPFSNEGGGEDADYLSDGMTEVLIGNLSKIPNLMVKARSSVFRYKGTNTDLKTIGRELGVDAILNGRITARGDQITLSLELMDAATENVLWSERYDRKQGDLVALQTEIARDISNRIESKISGEDITSGGTKTQNPEAYRAYLKGLFYFNKRAQKEYPKAIDHFQEAINKDPNFALAYVGKANTLAAWSESGLTPDETLAKTDEALNMALRLDPDLGPAYARLAGNAFYWRGDWKEAQRLYARALELDPGSLDAHQSYARALCFRKMFDACFAEYERALAIDPLSSVINSDLGSGYFYFRDYERAIRQFQKNIEMDPGFLRNYKRLATVYEVKREFEKAITMREEAFRLELGPETASERRKALEKALRENGSRGYWNQVLEWNLARRGIDPVDGYWEAAANYAELGELDQAFDTIDLAIQKASYAKFGLAVNPQFDKLRGDPRFHEILKRFDSPQ